MILTKLDGDARGGAALSIWAVTGKPIKFVGTGEKIDALELFHPERIASRILGMGDILSLIERAEEAISVEKAKEIERKLRRLGSIGRPMPDVELSILDEAGNALGACLAA